VNLTVDKNGMLMVLNLKIFEHVFVQVLFLSLKKVSNPNHLSTAFLDAFKIMYQLNKFPGHKKDLNYTEERIFSKKDRINVGSEVSYWNFEHLLCFRGLK